MSPPHSPSPTGPALSGLTMRTVAAELGMSLEPPSRELPWRDRVETFPHTADDARRARQLGDDEEFAGGLALLLAGLDREIG